ncbi:hypothetical protein JCM8202v2_004198 [Rhodotorula sphaerocarpa]
MLAAVACSLSLFPSPHPLHTYSYSADSLGADPPTLPKSNMSTISKTEVHAGAGDAGEGYKPPQGGPRYEEGKEHSHKNLDSTDERSIANKLAAAEKAEKEASDDGDAYKGAHAAEKHGNEPSRGAKVDQELEKEDAEMLAKKQK